MSSDGYGENYQAILNAQDPINPAIYVIERSTGIKVEYLPPPDGPVVIKPFDFGLERRVMVSTMPDNFHEKVKRIPGRPNVALDEAATLEGLKAMVKAAGRKIRYPGSGTR